MPIGYYNFGNIQQGNQQVINSLAGLGQQIGNAIETHAATQSAQAMLPMLQQQYQSGLSKIAGGDPNGMADVYGAAVTASQNPLLAPFAAHAVSTAQSANINAQHMARTLAYQQGKMASLYGQYGSGLMAAPEGMNPSWQGKQSQAKALNPAQQMSAMANFNKLDNDLAAKQADALRLGDQETYQQLGQQRQGLRDTLSQGGLNTPGLPSVASSFDTASQLRKAQSDLKAENAKHGIFGYGGPDKTKVQKLQNTIKQLQGSAIPATQAKSAPVNLQQGTGPVIPQKAIDYLMKNPSTSGDFDKLFGEGASQQILKPQQSINQSGGQQIEPVEGSEQQTASEEEE
jgi:hypothetical protein